MNGQQIGIKLADGSFYPVLGEQKAGRKRLVVTTARDNQDTVQIDLYAGEGELAEQTQYVGSLMIENIQPAPKREPEIEVTLGVDEQGTLEATASDVMTGESRSLSVSLPRADAGEGGATEFELESEGAASLVKGQDEEPEDSLLTGESYPISDSDRRKEHLRRKRRKPLLLLGFIVLSLILIAAIAFLVFRAIDGRPIPPLFGGKTETAGTAAEAAAESQDSTAGVPATGAAVPAGPAAGAEAQEETAQAIAGETDGGERSAAAVPEQETTLQSAAEGLWYEIKWGDTLWDISATYYRNPWLYPKIAKANHISNPDLIFAGTKLFIPEN